MGPDETEFGGRLVSGTEAYLDGILRTVEGLPGLLAAYRAGESHADAVASIRESESDCDRQNRAVCRLLIDSGPGEVGLARAQVHLNAAALVELYQRLDDVANATERAATELRAMAPRRDAACLDGLAELADRAVAAVRTLRGAVVEFIGVLCATVDAADLTAEVARIRETESRCDDLRTEVIGAAFDGDGNGGADPAAYRALAIQFDRIVDAAEDVTDRMCLLSRTVPRLAVEPHGS